MKTTAKVNEPKERLSATLEELMKMPQDKRHDRNPGAQLVRRAFKPVFQLVSQLEKSNRGRDALGFLALALPRR